MKTYKNIKLQHETEAGASHQAALIWAVENTSGDVLELGCGDYSTELLHELLKGTGRKLVSVDDNKEWTDRFIHMANDNHEFKVIDTDKWFVAIHEFAKAEWGVVLVDQGYDASGDTSRFYSVRKLVDHAEYVVAHDADLLPHMQIKDYNWKIFYPKYTPIPWRKGPPTYIISKRHDLSGIEIAED